MKQTLRNPKTILFITGGPGTGKSYAAGRLLDALEHLTLLSYDHVKEREWDRFGFDNAEQKDRLNRFCLEEYYLLLQKMMREGKTILTEYPFCQRHRGELEKLVQENGYQAVTLYLFGEQKTVYQRALCRDHGARHPGHLTNSYHLEEFQKNGVIKKDAVLSYEAFCSSIAGKDYNIQIGATIAMDVTDLSSVDYSGAIARIIELDRSAKQPESRPL